MKGILLLLVGVAAMLLFMISTPAIDAVQENAIQMNTSQTPFTVLGVTVDPAAAGQSADAQQDMKMYDSELACVFSRRGRLLPRRWGVGLRRDRRAVRWLVFRYRREI